MTESEWLKCSDPTLMLESLPGKLSMRRLRLFALACFKRIDGWDCDDRIRKAVEVAEQCANGRLTIFESHAIVEKLNLSWNDELLASLIQREGRSRDFWYGVTFTAALLAGNIDPDLASGIAKYVRWSIALQPLADSDIDSDDEDRMDEITRDARRAEGEKQADLLRDVCGNPFRPMVLDAPWITPQSVDLAKAIRDDHAVALYPKLADVLAAAGCHDADLLEHCMRATNHVEGCWALDVVLQNHILTDEEWNDCQELRKMLECLRHTYRLSTRKTRLLGVAMCRQIWNLLPTENCRNAVLVGERYADGKATHEESLAASEIAHHEGMTYPGGKRHERIKDATFASSQVAESDVAPEGVAWSAGMALGTENGMSVHKGLSVHIDLLRDIFRNPLQPATVDPSWQTPAVVELANVIYENRAFDRMPRLADALEEAGCRDADILSHCRSPSPHVRGCWVVDLLLEKK
ncbi:MAG: hypothetical protein WEB58_13090 [Planctomycetaceae bacterium]